MKRGSFYSGPSLLPSPDPLPIPLPIPLPFFFVFLHHRQNPNSRSQDLARERGGSASSDGDGGVGGQLGGSDSNTQWQTNPLCEEMVDRRWLARLVCSAGDLVQPYPANDDSNSEEWSSGGSSFTRAGQQQEERGQESRTGHQACPDPKT